jgi:hypothetical protein
MRCREALGFSAYFEGIFYTITRRTKNEGLNEYDAAAFFMLVQANTLGLEHAAGTPDKRALSEFVFRVLSNVRRNLPRCSAPSGVASWQEKVTKRLNQYLGLL